MALSMPHRARSKHAHRTGPTRRPKAHPDARGPTAGSLGTGIPALLIALLLVAGFGVRLYGITEPPLDFHPTRQYRSALIARAYYYAVVDPVAEHKRQTALACKNQQGLLEPPVMETLACLSYCAIGGEHLWIPRGISSVFWLLGGLFLCRIASRIASPGAVLYSTTFYLFLPFGVNASRSFQPDPTMVMLFLASLLSLVRFSENPSMRRLFAAALISASAMFIKPVCLFPILAAFVAITVSTCGLRAALRRPAFWSYIGLSLLPTILYYVYGMYIAGFLRGQAQGSLGSL